jgi:hypothetical protein
MNVNVEYDNLQELQEQNLFKIVRSLPPLLNAQLLDFVRLC